MIDLHKYYTRDAMTPSEAPSAPRVTNGDDVVHHAGDVSDAAGADEGGGTSSSSPSQLLVYCERGDLVRAKGLLASLSAAHAHFRSALCSDMRLGRPSLRIQLCFSRGMVCAGALCIWPSHATSRFPGL